MRIKSSNLLPSAAGLVALAGTNVHGAIVYQSFEAVLRDPDPTANNSNTDSIGAIRFDGTNITLNHTGANGAAQINAREQAGAGKSLSLATIFANQQYLQTATTLNAGDLIGTAFTPTNTRIDISENAGDASNLYIGVSTPTSQYGWIRFSYTNAGETVTIHDAAFQSVPGELITAGAIPEPASLAMVSLAGGALALRRRRGQTASAA